MADPVDPPVTDDSLLYLFRDNQAPKSIGSRAFRDMIVSLHLNTATFLDLPTSAAGLPAGRIYLNGDVLQVSRGGVPSSIAGQLTAAGSGSLTAAARAKLVAHLTLGGRGGLTATASLAYLFEDQFNTLSLYDQFGNVPGTWYPSQFWSPNNAGYVVDNTWILNPFNPLTPIGGRYSVSGGNLQLLMQNTPAQYLAACGAQRYIGTQVVAPFVATYGRFEARFSVPGINGTLCTFFLISNSGGDAPVTTEIDIMEIVTSASWSPRTQWATSIKPPGYPPGVGNVAEYYSYYPDTPLIDATQMNTYAAEVRPTYVSVEVNGVEVMRATPPAEFGNTPWCIYLGHGDGGAWTGPLDTNTAFTPMLVDYVRVTR